MQRPIPFPQPGVNDSWPDKLFGEPLKAVGNMSYAEFIDILQILWNRIYPDIDIVPVSSGKYAKYPCISYGIELRKAHNNEPKPKTRQFIKEVSQYIYGQRFQNIVAFTVMTRAEAGSIDSNASQEQQQSELMYVGAEVADKIIDIFEDFMLEYTPVFKALGASEFVYARRLSDEEINKDQTDIVKRTVTYMLTTEKLMAASVDKIEKIVLDVRTYYAYEKSLVEQSQRMATPNLDNTEINIVDLYQSATPNQ
jgi:uncharacterized membrane protein